MGDQRSFKSGVVIAIATGTFLAGCVGGCTFGVLTSNNSSDSKPPSREGGLMRALDEGGVRLKESTAVRLAHEACNTLRRGGSKVTRSEVVMAATVRENLNPHDAAVLVGAAIGAYCPEYASRAWE